MSMIFLPAKRENIIPLIGIFGKSASGKTLSGLKIARGLVGPKGKIAVTDTENKRASHFADDPSVAPFFALNLDPPFSPGKYRECHEEAIAMGADVHVIDSASHEWTGEGGCLQMVEKFLDDKCQDNYAKRDKFKMMAWARVTPEHDLWVNALMRSKIPVICCFRAKDKVVMEKTDEGTKITTDFDAPIARKDLIYEMLMALECHQGDVEGQQSGGYFHVRKPGPPSLHKILTQFKDEKLSPAIGELIAQWCKAPITPGSGKTLPDKKEFDDLKRELWAITKEKRTDDPSTLDQWLLDESILSDTETLKGLTLDRLKVVVTKTKEKLRK